MLYSLVWLLLLFSPSCKGSSPNLRRRDIDVPNQIRPLILDTDYGPFVDDGFAVGLALQAPDVFDLKLVMATGIEVCEADRQTMCYEVVFLCLH